MSIEKIEQSDFINPKGSCMRQDEMAVLDKPFIIPVFLPNAGCPHQCAFCNQTAITGERQKKISSEKLNSYINEFINHKGPQRKKIQISFYGGNFLGLKKDYVCSLLDEASKFVRQGRVDSLRFSTRPDTIDKDRLVIIKDYPVSTIELGVQSMDDRVLAMARRGHTAVDTEKAVCLLKERNYEIGIQMMVGLPGDSDTGAFATGRRIAGLYPDFVRIYPTLVLDKSPLAGWYRKGEYTPLSLKKCVSLVKRLYLLFEEKNIIVIRMGLQASESLSKESTILAGPYHPAFGHLVFSEIFLDKALAAMELENPLRDRISIKVNPKNISRIRGLNNSNIEILKKRFNIKAIQIIPDLNLTENALLVEPPIESDFVSGFVC
ncbi:MAG: radical SAM protein [Candidatus Desulfaltia sp.]|nr:radical SAM protein [Candidatus Desulfaltia sp.]